MLGIFVGIVVFRVVTTDECPARMLTGVLVRPMKRIPVKENRGSRFKFTVDKWQPLERRGDPFGISTGLFSNFAVIHPPHQVRMLHDL